MNKTNIFIPKFILPSLIVTFMLILGFNAVFGQSQNAMYKLADYTVEISGDFRDFTLTFDVEKIEPGLEIANLKLTNPNPAAPPEFSLKWSLPSHDILGHWSTGSYFNKTLHADWWPSRVTSMLAKNAPVISLFGSDNQNRLTFAVSDGLNTVRLSSGIREEDGRVYNQINFFTEKHRKLKVYQVEIRFDRRAISYFDALNEVSLWWASHPDYKPSTVPEYARLPMYSTWYSYHQNVSAQALLKEVEIAKQMGFESIIVDDGWQTLDSNRGYAYTGDWQPERIPDMKGFVDAVHHLGMKFLLWYSVPLVGEKSKVYEKFKGKYLRYWDGQGAYEFDPRYPEVREHVINTYKMALQEWDVDGFKLDFIGRFAANKSTVLEAADGRDFASVNEATDRLMTDIMDKLRKLKPDVMIEFRQPYIGPLMRKYGNMFRAGDSPNAFVANRVRTVDLRLLSGDTAVHSDMIMWHYEEPVEIAAFQFLNIIFSVPQVSVRLADVPEDHFKMIKFYTNYWTQNRAVLLDGKLEALYPLANYPILIGYSQTKQIIGLYSDMFISLDHKKPVKNIDIINAKKSEKVILNIGQKLGTYKYMILDCQGKVQQNQQIVLERGIRVFSVPVSGMISLVRTN